jgi:Tfp pilus assembly ATPase PilU
MVPSYSEEIRMFTLKGAALATVIAAASLTTATAVQARDIAINQEGQMIIVGGDGQGVIGTMKSMDLFKNAKPLAGGVVIFMHNGKVYMMDDPESAMFKHRTDVGQF